MDFWYRPTGQKNSRKCSEMPPTGPLRETDGVASAGTWTKEQEKRGWPRGSRQGNRRHEPSRLLEKCPEIIQSSGLLQEPEDFQGFMGRIQRSVKSQASNIKRKLRYCKIFVIKICSPSRALLLHHFSAYKSFIALGTLRWFKASLVYIIGFMPSKAT